MAAAPGILEQHRQVLLQAREVLDVLGEALYQAQGEELGALLSEVDAVASGAAGSAVRWSWRPNAGV